MRECGCPGDPWSNPCKHEGRFGTHPRRCVHRHKRDRTRRCGRLGILGTEPPGCPKHGAGAPQVRRKAEQRLALAEATKTARSILGSAGGAMDPLDALVRTQEYCEEMILTYTIVVDALRERGGDAALVVTDAKGTTTSHPHLVELRHWTADLAKVATSQLKQNVDERRVQVSEVQLAQMRKRIEGYAHEKGIDLTDPKEIRLIQRWFTGPMPTAIAGQLAA